MTLSACESRPTPADPVTARIAALVDEHLHLVDQAATWYAGRLPRHIASREELHQAALVGLWQATQSHDPARGVLFVTHAYRRVRGAIVDWLRDSGPVKRGGLARGERSPRQLSEEIADRLRARPAALAGQLEAREEVDRILRRLPELARRCVRLYHLEGLTMLEISVQVGVGESRVSQILAQSLTYLRTTTEHEREQLAGGLGRD